MNNHLIRMYAATFREHLSHISHDPARYVDKSTVDQVEADLAEARTNLPGIPLPRWEENYFRDFSDGSGHHYRRNEVRAFVARLAARLEALAGEGGGAVSASSPAVDAMRAAISRISSSSVRKFVIEALQCLEAGLVRAAVVFSWVGAVAVLHDYVARTKLTEFNSVAVTRDSKWRAQTAEDLERIKEFDFLQILETISVIDKAIKHDLEACLKLRNACGHPTMLELSDAKVAAHIETLVLNVYLRFV